MHRIRTIGVATVLALLSISARAATEDSINRNFNVQPGGTLTIDADLGDIVVRTSTANQVSVNVVRKGRTSDIHDYEVTFSQEGNDVRIRGKYEHKWRFFDWNNLQARFTVTVPTTYNVHLGTSGGDIKVSDLHGEALCKTSGGDLDLGHIQGSVDARTSGGDVRVSSASGKVELKTSGGDIQAGDVNGPLTARTSGGDIEVHRVQGDVLARSSGGGIDVGEVFGAIDASTSGGSIRAKLLQQPKGDSRLSTSGGSITIALAGMVAVDLDAHTSGGDVNADVPVTVQGRQSDSTLAGRINGGGPRLVLRSSGGDIHVRRN
jgi:DUF4097 and DUF4098 domain-containing protein YvlB